MSFITRHLKRIPKKEDTKKEDEIETTSEDPPIIENKSHEDSSIVRSLCDYSTLKYIDSSTLIEPDINLYFFNSCICKYKKGYRLFYRSGRNPKSVHDRIATCLLSPNLKVVPNSNKYVDVFSNFNESQISGDHTSKPRQLLYSYFDDAKKYKQKSYIYKNNEHVEDPRVIEFNNSWFMIYTDGLGIAVAKLNLNTCDVIYSHFLNSPHKKYIPENSDGREKNWIMCTDKDRLFLLYCETPRTFLEYKDTGKSLNCIGIFKDNYSVKWPFGDVRGGCPPINYDNGKLIWFFHSVKKINTHIGDDSKVYMIGAYLTTSTYPFKVTDISTHPVLVGIPSHISPNVLLQDNVVYPCGAIALDSQTFLISMGINDYKIAHLEVKKDMLLMNRFTPILESLKFVT
jgi:predicted GH43/DUF377 family glycosyl hydrolase